MYSIDDRFFETVQDIAEYIEYEDLVEQAEDYTVEAYECDLETIGFLSGESIAERAFDEDRFSEEMHEDQEKIARMLNANIDFEAINDLLPKLWYPSDRKVIFTKLELLSELRDYNE